MQKLASVRSSSHWSMTLFAAEEDGAAFADCLDVPAALEKRLSFRSVLALASRGGVLGLRLEKPRRSASQALGALAAEAGRAGLDLELRRGGPILDRLFLELEEYFAGRRRAFTVPLDDHRLGTEFQRAVWAGLRRIPFGETRSYAELAAAVGLPGAARAVGQANGRNPAPILNPCHRVIAAGGRLGGFTGGLDIKRGLLRHEGAALVEALPAPRRRVAAASGRRG
jgi:methylated-DNA-[protein]-cysteine S-methyltransferase